jgi:cytochrome d ubiquinol oxidase subunit I
MLDALLLSRIQFAFTVSFHILFPAFTIGLASWLVMLEFLWLRTGKPAYQSLYRFWLKIFAVSFGLGVVSGLVMSFEFGTNWSEFSRATANVIGPLLGYQVMTAFFLEATFLGIMLFGADRVGRGVHFFATCAVAVGTLVSAFWILAANSWMHTPAGFRIENGVYFPERWVEIIFNPSFPYRFAHMVLAAYLTTCFVVAGIAASYLNRGLFPRRSALMLKLAVVFASIVVPMQIVVGDLHGLNTEAHQPVKVAAMEAHWQPRAGAPLLLLAWPDEAAERNRFELGIPKLGSLILRHDTRAAVRGLTEFPADERPPVAPVFYAFRVMVGLGVLMLVAAWTGAIQFARGKLLESRRLLRVLPWMIPAGFLAMLGGWVTTEVGRQPYLVYGLLRTAEGVSAVPGASVGVTLALFLGVYGGAFGAGLYYLVRLFRTGPLQVEPAEQGYPTAHRPLSVPAEGFEESLPR